MQAVPSFSEIVESLCRPGEVTVLGVTGQAGAGKTNHVSPLIVAEAKKRNFPVELLRLDSFFKLSSADRKIWIAEGEKISPEEAASRHNMLNWWDFDKVKEALLTLKRKQDLLLSGVYNRSDGGNLTAEVNISPDPKGMLLIFEGVAICHLNIDHLMYVYAPPEVRLERLRNRDKHRQGKEVYDRFMITETFERSYFPKHWDRISYFIGNSVEAPKVMQNIPCCLALGLNGESQTA